MIVTSALPSVARQRTIPAPRPIFIPRNPAIFDRCDTLLRCFTLHARSKFGEEGSVQRSAAVDLLVLGRFRVRVCAYTVAPNDRKKLNRRKFSAAARSGRLLNNIFPARNPLVAVSGWSHGPISLPGSLL